MSKQIALISEQKEVGLALFENASISGLLDQVKAKVAEFTPDTSTAKGRKEIASMAAKVSTSKTYIDGLGKTLVADEKSRLKLVDVERKRFRDECDILRDKTRLPLTEWEAVEAKRIESERLAKEILGDWEAAISENDLVDRQIAIESAEAKLAADAEVKRLKDEAEQQERDRVANEERIKVAAAEKAKLEAEQEIQKVKDEAAKREADAVLAKELAERKTKQAKIDADTLAKKTREDAENAAIQAEADKAQAVKDAQAESDRKAKAAEDQRLEAERAAKAAADKKSANKQHQSKVMKATKESLIKFGLEEVFAKKLVLAMAKGEIINVKVEF